jgi:hypothetical protein
MYKTTSSSPLFPSSSTHNHPSPKVQIQTTMSALLLSQDNKLNALCVIVEKAKAFGTMSSVTRGNKQKGIV